MCGFAGVVVWDERLRVSRETLERMSAKIAHRGPDGDGLYLNHETEIRPDRPQVGLVHRRLAILDPDPRSNQPFTDNHGRWIVFNGEIYNFRELRAELTRLKPDYAWRTNGDTEVLLVSYDVWGDQCVERLNGMFAFAIWDDPRQRLFLARDRMGQKPLYVATPYCSPKVTAIAFGSELTALRQVPWFRTDIDASVLAEYLQWGYIGNESTIYGDVGKLAPGMWQSFAGGVREGDYYFDPNRPDPTQDDHVLRTRELVTEAVRRQLVSDVPVGCLLSGGIDSSVVAAAAQLALPDKQALLTFSIRFDDPRYDESPFAEQVAQHLGTEHHQFTIKPDAAGDLPALAEVYGEPFGDSSALPVHYLSRETRKAVKVALSGDGGDELFGGYDRYRAMRLGRHLCRIPARLRSAVARTAAPTMAGKHPKSRVARVGRFLGSLDQLDASRYAGYLRLFADELVAGLLGGAPEVSDHVAAQYESLARTLDPVQAALATDRLTYLPDDLLTKLDRASMLHALEVRSPFMDHELVQFAASLTTDQLLKGGPKRMLREAFDPDLPAWVFRRKKMGFAVPIGDWFRGELRPMLRDHLFAANSFASTHFNRTVVERLVDEHERQWIDHSQRLYALLMLELWWRLQ